MDVEIEQDDLNQKFLTSLAPEWLMHMIVWRNKSDLDTMSLDDLYNHLKVYESKVQKKSDPNSHNMAFISSAKHSRGNEEVNTAIVSTSSTNVPTASANIGVANISQDTTCAYIASQSSGSQIKFEDINQIDEDDMEEMDIKWKMALLSMRADKFWKKIGKKISIQGSDVAGFDKSKELELIKKEKEGLNSKLTGLQTASKDLDILFKSQRLDKNKEGLGYSDALPPPAQIYSSPKKDMSWTSLPEFKDDTVTDYSRPAPTIESSPDDAQNRNPLVTEEASPSTISPKYFIKFVKANDNPTNSKTDKAETAKKSLVKYAEQYRKPTKKPNVRGNQSNWNNLKSHQLGPNFVMKKNACFNCGDFNHLAYDYRKRVKKGTSRSQNNTHKSFTPRPVVHKPYRPLMRPMRSNMNGAWPNRTSFNKLAHSYANRPFQRTSTVRPQYRAPWVPSVNRNVPPVNRKFSTLSDDDNVLLRTPRQHNMYSIDLNNIVPHRDLTCLVAKASADERMLWHRRLGHLNFKTMNKLVRHNLVRGLPTKCFENDHTCTACLKGKQHKASFKSKLVNSISKPLHTLHMDLFGPTSVSSISHKWYCLVVTDDFSRFTWTFFFKTKDETSGILRKFITKIENLKDLKVKIIKCDNGGEFRNKEMNDFCSQKGIKREFSNARTPQQNAEVVNTACYVQNRVLVTKSQNKTSYELFNGRTLAIGFLKPFGCHVMILNTLNNLGRFEAKGDQGYFIGYSMSSNAFRVFNKRTKRVEENLHVEFIENKAIEKGAGPNWLFDIDSLTKSMNYVPVDAGTIFTNLSGIKDAAKQEVKKDVSSLKYIALPNWIHDALLESSSTDQLETLTVETPIPTVSSLVPTACLNDSLDPSSDTRLSSKRVVNQEETPSLYNILTLTNRFEDILRVTTNSVDSDGVEADVSNMEISITASPTPTLRIHKDHPKSKIIGPVDTLIQTRNKSKEISNALQDPSWVEAMQEELLQFKIQNVWTLVDYPKGKEDSIFLSQDKYVGDILKKFGYSDVRSSNTPMDKENPGGKDGTGKDVDLYLYRSMIGSLMYLIASRPDIMFDVYACVRHQVTPKECHLHANKRIFRYLTGHPKLGLWYPKESPFDLLAYSDSDYVSRAFY
nr:hypothetical protein [Tanacetum cinerariifolium]